MGKISKEAMKRHSKAMEILEKDELSFDDKVYVLENYHEGATNMNNLISAHFTPMQLAWSMEQNTGYTNFVDLCSGIGILSWCMVRGYQMGHMSHKKDQIGICIEYCEEYYNIGKKLLPELHWINGSIFDDKVIAEVKEIMGDKSFSIISNPPYGRQVKTDTKHLLKYKGPEFEYKAIEVGSLMGASNGSFLIPQGSCNFKITGVSGYEKVEDNSKYNKFAKETNLTMRPNNGYTTEITEGEDGWKDVSIITEIAIFDYEEDRDEIEETPKLRYVDPIINPDTEFMTKKEIIEKFGDNEQLTLF